MLSTDPQGGNCTVECKTRLRDGARNPTLLCFGSVSRVTVMHMHVRKTGLAHKPLFFAGHEPGRLQAEEQAEKSTIRPKSETK